MPAASAISALAGISSHCRKRAALGIRDYPGVFADRLRLPVRNLHAVPDAIPDEVAVFTEPLAAALQVLEMVSIPRTTVYSWSAQASSACWLRRFCSGQAVT